MKQENQFDEKSNNKINSDLINKFKEEFRPKSHFEDFRIMYSAGGAVRYILQILSVLTAATLVAYPSKYFFNTWIYGIFFAAVLLFFLELAKRTTSDVGFRKYFSEGKVPVLVVMAGIIISAGSIILSVLGTPILVSEFVPLPELISIKAIEASAKEKENQTTSFWSAQIDSAEAKSEATFSGGSWKGKIHGETKTQVYQYDTKATAGQDSLNKYLAVIKTDLIKATASAKTENDLTTIEDDKQTATVGFWTAIACGILEVLFYIISFFLVRFRYISSIQLSDSDTPSTPNPTGGNKGRNKRKQKETSDFFQDLFEDVSEHQINKGNILNETGNKTISNLETVPETTSETETKNRKQETEQKQAAERSATIDGSKESRNRTESKTFILNKDVNHGTPTVKNGSKVLYYITNRNKKNEGVQYYTVKQIGKMIDGYSKRLQEAKYKKNLKSIATNRAKLKDWKAYRERLNSYEPEIV